MVKKAAPKKTPIKKIIARYPAPKKVPSVPKTKPIEKKKAIPKATSCPKGYTPPQYTKFLS